MVALLRIVNHTSNGYCKLTFLYLNIPLLNIFILMILTFADTLRILVVGLPQ